MTVSTGSSSLLWATVFAFAFVAVVGLIAHLIYRKNIESFDAGPSADGELASLGPIENLQAGDVLMAKVYANWCPHCKNMASEWKQYYDDNHELRTGGSTVYVVSIEQNNPLTAQAMHRIGYAPRGYPAVLRVTRKGDDYQVDECSWPRTVDNWQRFAAEVN